MTLQEWKEKVIENQGFDGLGDLFVSESGDLYFRWRGYTYGAMGDGEKPFVRPTATAWIGLDFSTMTRYDGPAIDWSQDVEEFKNYVQSNSNS